MKLVFDTTQAMYLEITGDGGDQLNVTTVIDGLRNDKVVDAKIDKLDFYNTGKVLVGKLRFIK